ncbi:AraC family transcriptional regulator [Arthrobacter sp. StoSoilB20]|nr:AraC family transcriptional regulator [Arthrobacter sp. StoSoilB20]
MAGQHFVALDPYPLRHRPSHFRAEIETARCGDLRISSLQASQVHVRRGSRQLRDSNPDLVLAGFQLAGAAMVLQDDRTAVLRPGEFTFFDTSRPYEIEATQSFRQVVIAFPRERFSTQVPAFDRATAVTLDASRSSNALLLRMVDQLGLNLPQGSIRELEGVAAGVENVAIATLRALVKDDSEVPRSEQTRAQIIHFVMRNLRDPSLNVARVASDLHLSESTVYRAFKDFGTSLPDFIWQRRLEGIREDLNAADLKSSRLGHIASQWGYYDYSLFSKKFKASTGLSPRQYLNTPASSGPDHLER